MTIHRLGLPACALLVGCWTDVRPPPPSVPAPDEAGEHVEAGEAPASPAPPAATDETEVDTAELAPPLPTIRFSDTGQTPRERVRRWFSAAPSHLERCGGAKGHTVKVYVSARDGDVFASLDETDADARTTGCVLETLALELDNALLDQTLSPSMSPSERLAPVESMIILSW